MKTFSFKLSYSGEYTIYVIMGANQEDCWKKLEETTNIAKRQSDWEIKELDKEVNFIS